MNPLELEKIIFEACAKTSFPLDVSEIFISLKNNKIFMDCIKTRTNEYQNFNNELLYDRIRTTYLKNKKFFNPIFKYDIDPAIIDGNQPRLCLGLHSNFSPLTALLISKSLNFVVVSDYPETIKRVAFASGLRSGNIKIISSDKTCLLNTKKFLKKNFLVSSTIDFKLQMPGTYNMLSDGMFKIAESVQPRTFFGINFVSDIGELNYISINLDLDGGIEKIKKDVIAFLKSIKMNAKYQFGKFDYLEQKRLLDSMNYANNI
jgi:hypothetical protein